MLQEQPYVGRYAQTRIQLLRQLRECGYDSDALVTIDRAHAYALELFSGSYRASGKPFLCHLIGTASVLASLASPAPLVAAGLLHAAYQLGDFGAGWLGRSHLKREQLRRRMGGEIEGLIDRYTEHPWDADTPAALAQRRARGESIDRPIVIMRLANEVDDHLDLGVLYYRNAAERLERVRQGRQALIDLAHHVDQPRLAHALTLVFDQCLSAQVPDTLRTAHDHAFVVPPISRTRWRLRRAAATIRRRA